MKKILLKTGRLLERFVLIFSRPLRENMLFVVFMFAAWGITVWRQVQYDGDVMLHCAELLVDLYFLCLLFTILPRRVAWVVRMICYVVGYSLAAFEVFLTERFLMLFTPTTFRLWNETTGEETREFLSAYLQGDKLWFTLLLYVPLIAANVGLWLLLRHRKAGRALSVGLGTVITVLMGLSASSWVTEKGRMIDFFEQKSTQTAETVKWQTFYTPLYRIIYSQRMLVLADRALVDLKRNMRELAIKDCSFRCPKIVLVIGESYNKYHSQLYGYKRATTPRQMGMKEEGSLHVFSNVVSAWNLTSNVFKTLFSTHSVEQPGTWCDGVLFPAIFKRAGYRVDFLTNQFQNVKRQSGIDFNGSFFLNDPEMDSLCFDRRNRMIYRYDRAFINEYKKLPETEHNLVIFHLYGQHQKYDYRFTERDVYFTVDSMKDRKNLTRAMKQNLADYDNATRYNDDVFGRICKFFENKDAIVVYLSDHGEEIYDHSLMFGRTPADPLIPLVAHYEFEVPMMIWLSSEMKKRHPDVERAVKAATDRPFMTDDLCHLLMGLGGIKCDYYDEKRDLLSDHFNEKRERLLKGKFNYDSLMKRSRYERERIRAVIPLQQFEPKKL